MWFDENETKDVHLLRPPNRIKWMTKTIELLGTKNISQDSEIMVVTNKNEIKKENTVACCLSIELKNVQTKDRNSQFKLLFEAKRTMTQKTMLRMSKIFPIAFDVKHKWTKILIYFFFVKYSVECIVIGNEWSHKATHLNSRQF